MQRKWRWNSVRSCALGAALTLCVAAIDWLGGFSPLERQLYDWRALHFQHFTPPPTDRLVHLDIDGAALETVGRWPWPRGTWAEIVDEVRLAGADVLALDVIFAEPTTALVDGKPVATDDDAVLAAAFERFGRVLVPVSFGELSFRQPPSPSFTAAVDALYADLGLDERGVNAKLPAGLSALGEDAYLAARRAAISKRIGEELARDGRLTDDELRGRVLTSLAATVNVPAVSRQLDTQLRRARSIRETLRFARERPPSCPPLLSGSEYELLPAFARTARYSGFVNDVPSEDGTIRGVPLWVEFEGRIYPQFDLAIACAALGADPRTASVEPGRVSVPLPDGRTMVVPVRTIRQAVSGDTAGDIGTYYDIPWFGWKEWATIYDHRAWREKKQHVPIAVAWGLAASRRIVLQNISRVSGELAELQGRGHVRRASPSLPPLAPDDIAGWLARTEPAVEDASIFLTAMEGEPAATRTTEDQKDMNACHALRHATREGRLFLQKAEELKRLLHGKVVLVGSTATGALDQRPTSLHPACPGVVVHGATAHALLTGAAWRFAPAWVTAAVALGLGLLVTVTVTWLPPWKSLVGTLVIAGAYLALNTIVLFDYGDRVVGLAGPLAAAAVAWGTLTVVRFVIERAERARITKKFRGYVDPQLVEYVVKHPELARFDGQVREMTVCFTDLAGFTTMTERLKEQAVPILGRYINRMVKVMRKHRGFLNRLMGDGIMFSYGAPLENPSHAVDAVTTVLEMQEEMTALNRELEAEGLPQLAVRGGVSTGRVVVGDSGGTEAVDYTCLGDVTNFGARLESANKYTGTTNLISARTAELLDGRFLLRPVGLLQVVGKTKSVMTFEPLARTPEATDDHRKLAAVTRLMVDQFQAGRFDECVKAADALDEAFGPSKLAKLYRDTCARYAADGTPAGFQGEIVLTDK